MRRFRWSEPRRARAVAEYGFHAKALAALGRRDFDEAYQYATAMSPAGTLAPHVPAAPWAVMDVVESGVRGGRHAEATARVNAMRQAGLCKLSPRLALLEAGSAAMAAPDNTAIGLFKEALAIPSASRWQLDLARIAHMCEQVESVQRQRVEIDPSQMLYVCVCVSLGRVWGRRANRTLPS